LLASGEGSADFGSPAVGLGRFDEHPAGMGVAAFGDGALAAFGTATVFSGNESEEGHELTGMTKAAEISELTDNGHGGDFLKTFAGHEGAHDGFPFPVREDAFEMIFEAGDALEASINGLNIFF